MQGGLRSSRDRAKDLENKLVRVNGTNITFEAQLFEQGKKVGYWNEDKQDYDLFDTDTVTLVK